MESFRIVYSHYRASNAIKARRIDPFNAGVAVAIAAEFLLGCGVYIAPLEPGDQLAAPQGLFGRGVGAVLKRLVHIAKVCKMVDLVRAEKQRGGEAVDWGVPPALVVEAAVLVKEAEEVAVLG